MNDLNKYYQLIGCSETATDDELYTAYLALRTKYQNDRFLEGEEGNRAAQKLTELNEAYAYIVDYRKNKSSENKGSFSKVDEYIKADKINEAQAALDEFDERNAEWHYLQSVVFYKKHWINESKKQLEIAMQMDESNQKYKNSYEKLCKQINFNANSANRNNNGGNANGGYRNQNEGGTYEEPTEMMGGDSCLDFCCRMAVCNMLLNCCCNCR